MKIERIYLTAYGPFSGVTLDLADAGSDFHLIFGLNEAGKSTALRALRYMLFGIPARTGDNFLHGYGKLRIGARLENERGERIDFLRRKGQLKTLRDLSDETVLHDDALKPFLGGISADVFEQMFAIGHEDLIRGGEEIISGKGSVGEALFAAGAGLTRLQLVQGELEQACGALFKPGGSTPAINQTTKAIKAARQGQKDALLLPKSWQEIDERLRAATRRAAEIGERLAIHKKNKERLERIRQALPLIARKKEIDGERLRYEGVPDLADDFTDMRRDTEKELKIAARDLDRSQKGAIDIERELEAIPDHRALIDHASVIGSLQLSLGSFRAAQKDRPGLVGRRQTLLKQAADSLEAMRADIDAASVETLRLPPSTASEIQGLGREHERLVAQKEADEQQRRRRTTRYRQLKAQRKAMPVPVDVSDLETALQAIQDAGPVEARLVELRTAVETLEDTLNRMLKRQQLWDGALSEVDQVPLPSMENVDFFEKRFDEMRQTVEKRREQLAAAEEEIALIKADLRAVDLSREVPTEADLALAREVRDRGWSLVRRQIEDPPPSETAVRDFLDCFESAATLAEAFGESMTRADHIADRLRREADQVSRKGLLTARMTALDQTCSRLTDEYEKALEERDGLDARWHRLWAPSGVAPQSPREMRGWLSNIDALRGKVGELRSLKRQMADLASKADRLTSQLRRQMAAAGADAGAEATLAMLQKKARASVQAQQEIARGIAEAEKELSILEVELHEDAAAAVEQEEKRDRWKARWQKSLRKVGIRADATPAEAIAVIETMREIRNRFSEADVLRKRIEGIDRDSDGFKAEVDKLVAMLAPDLAGEAQPAAAEKLNGRLTGARKDESRRHLLAQRLDAVRAEAEDAKSRVFACQEQMAALAREAGCSSSEDLAETERRSRVKMRLDRERRDLEQQIRSLSAGATVDAFMAEAAALEVDAIVPEIEERQKAINTLELERSTLHENIGALKTTLERMDGRADAVAHAEEAERLLAGLESQVEKFAQLKIASIILSRTVEQYREKHQGPLISRAGVLFSQMTNGAFSRLRADYDDKGNPVLIGLRAQNESPVSVEGMSDGTADQLYLALRLASLEQFLEHNEPLPFVVDDILLRFDDRRAMATLKALVTLSKKTQVLFFTHHRHLVDLARKQLETAKLSVLELHAR